MHVRVRQETVRRGLTFRTYSKVTFSVTLTNEERMVIKKARLRDYILWEREPPADVRPVPQNEHKWWMYVKDILKDKPHSYLTQSDIAAAYYIDELQQRLTVLKNVLNDMAETDERVTFEL